MEYLIIILIHAVNTIIDSVNLFLFGGSLTLAFALGAVGYSNITEGVMANTRRWHGGIDDRFAAIDNAVRLITAHQPAWVIPADLLALLTNNHNLLQELINRCRSNQGSRADREQRNSLLKTTVSLCLIQVKIWAYSQYTAGVLTAEDVHLLGFLIPGESGGKHVRTEPTDITAEVKVRVINEDFIRVVIDQSAGENAAQTAHGWPPGVKKALIVIVSADGTTEVLRLFTTRLHNDIRMPEGSHGKQFIIKAAFLKHINDEPRFGNEPTFSMPLTTEDLAAALARQRREDFEEKQREIDRQRQEIERLTAALNTKK